MKDNKREKKGDIRKRSILIVNILITLILVLCLNFNILNNISYAEGDVVYQKKVEILSTPDIDTKGKILEKREVFKGSLAMSVVHPREVFKNAIKNSAASIVCVHNHPSGDPTPSIEDLLTTINLIEVGDVVGIEMLDHIVVAKEGYVSIRKILNYFNLENIDYKNKEVTREQLQFILKKYKIVNNF